MQVDHETESEQRANRANRRQIVVAIVAMAVVAVGLWVILDDARWSRSPPAIDSPLVLAERWVEAMNGGDLDGALALLSPRARCDLPVPDGRVETCEQQLGFMVDTGTRIDDLSCRASAPYLCTHRLSSDLHTELGYPNPTLRMIAVYQVDEDGLLNAHLFREWEPNDAYYPGALVEFWRFLADRNPELAVDPTFGPALYDSPAAATMLEAAEEFTDPRRIVRELQARLDEGDAGEIVQCATGDGSRVCSELFEFLAAIDADIDLSCDVEAVGDGGIPCQATVDSSVHRALGSGPSTDSLIISSVGGVVRGFELALTFSDDPSTNEAFMGHARERMGSSEVRPLFTGDSGAEWVAAAEDFSADR